MANQQTQHVSPSPVEGMMHVMRSVLLQLSGLAGILAFLAHMWDHNPLNQSLYTGVIVGGGVYIILLFVDVVFQWIVAAHVESVREEAKVRAQEKANDSSGPAEKSTQETSGTNPAPESQKNADSSSQTGESTPTIAAESAANNASNDQQIATV